MLARRSGYSQVMTPLPDKLAAIRAAKVAFRDAGVSYALIGGVAVGVRSGVARATLDVDFAVPTAVDRAGLIARFLTHGFQLKGQYSHSINLRHDSGEPCSARPASPTSRSSASPRTSRTSTSSSAKTEWAPARDRFGNGSYANGRFVGCGLA